MRLRLSPPEMAQCAAQGKPATKGQREKNQRKIIDPLLTPPNVIFRLWAKRRFSTDPMLRVFHIIGLRCFRKYLHRAP